jgi:hypothetical protein
MFIASKRSLKNLIAFFKPLPVYVNTTQVFVASLQRCEPGESLILILPFQTIEAT